MTQAFNLSQFANKVNTSGQADLTTAVTGTLPIANGGTGAASLTGNSVAITNSGGTALSTVAAGTTGNVLTSNGTTWISQAASGGQLQTELFTAPGTWTKPASATQVRVTVIGGGGGSSAPTNPGGQGGLAVAIVPVSAPVTITVGAGGNAGVSGGTSSFGPAVSATGGAGGNPAGFGTGTVSVGTALKTNSASYSSDAIGILFGSGSRPSIGFPGSPGTPYTTSSAFIAGARATAGSATSSGGIGGAIVVEFVG
jgi:hypothetical protein